MTAQDSVEQVRRDLVTAGLDADLVGWAGDRDLPLIDGVLLARPDGASVTVSIWERGREFDVRTFASEEDAAGDLRARLLRQPAPRRTTAEQRAASRERMQRKADETLARLAARAGAEGGEDD
jgi:hypothetical protein